MRRAVGRLPRYTLRAGSVQFVPTHAETYVFYHRAGLLASQTHAFRSASGVVRD